jgi:hypothetical protein
MVRGRAEGGSSAGAHFIDLRANPYDIAEIVEAEHNTTLARALRSLNATRSPFLTAKCDTWTLSATEQPETLEALRMELLLHEEDARFGYASYIDLLWRERSVFASAHQQQDRLDRIVAGPSGCPTPRWRWNAFCDRRFSISAARSKVLLLRFI